MVSNPENFQEWCSFFDKVKGKEQLNMVEPSQYIIGNRFTDNAIDLVGLV